MTSIPEPYASGHQGALNKSTAFWAHRAVSQLAEKHYNRIHADIKELVDERETASLALQAKWDVTWDPKTSQHSALTKAFSDNAAGVVERWWSLFDHLLFKYLTVG